jgi:ferredoxin
MPIAILPDIDEQRCIGCALCVEICTTLGPDVLRVKPVEGWKRGKAFVFYPERCISDGACIGVCPTKSSLIDCIFQHTFFSYFYFRDFLLIPFGSNLIKFATKLSPLSK